MVKAGAETDTIAPNERALSESFWGRGGERRSRTDHPTARVGAPPPPGGGRRRTSQPARARGRRGQTFLALLMVGVMLAALVAGGWWWRNKVQTKPARPATTAGSAAPSAPAASAKTATKPVPVFVHKAPDGRLDLVALVSADGTTGAVTMVPTATQLEVPGNGIQQLSELARLGGTPLVDLALENALGVATVPSVALEDATIQAMLEPAGPLLVKLAAPITIADPALKLPAGSQTVTPAQAAILLTRSAGGASELDHLDAVRIVLDAWSEALRKPEVAAATIAKVSQAEPFVAAAKLNPRLDTIPVDSIGLGADERYQLQSSDADALLAKVAPNAQYRPGGGRPRIEVKTDTDEAMLGASACIVGAGGNIRLTGRAEPADKTNVVFYRDRSADTARQMQAALKAGSVKKADRDLDLVDVTIVVGKDFIGCQ